MAEFFVPHADTPEQAEKVWQGIKKFAEDNMDRTVGDERIQRIDYQHDGGSHTAEVGKVDQRTNEPVFAILDAGDLYLVCTANRGTLRGLPILVGKGSAFFVENFD